MTRTELLKLKAAEPSLRCDDCRTLAVADEPYCGACGGHLSPRKKSRFPYDAVAALVGIGAAMLVLIGRN